MKSQSATGLNWEGRNVVRRSGIAQDKIRLGLQHLDGRSVARLREKRRNVCSFGRRQQWQND
jgi:hypothetical protein